MTTVNLGRLRYNYRGNWSNVTEYKFNDLVNFGGYMYLFINATAATGSVPTTDGANWSVFLRGMRYAGAWSSVTEYKFGEFVARGGKIYLSTAVSTNSEPPSANWVLLLDGTRFLGAYAGGTEYLPGDVVIGAGNSLFVNKLKSTGVVTTNTTNWDLFLQGSTFAGSSTTSLLVATGSKAFAGVGSGLGYTVGQRLRASSISGPANFMEGVVASYTGGTVTLTVDKIGGSGTLADWSINVAGQPGLDGVAGRILGEVTLVAGTATITGQPLVDADSKVYCNRMITGGTPGHLSVVRNVGTGFTINSSSGSDTSTVVWELVP